ncbi:hypothetical protein FCM35_KLT07891 [Carex littledalei]|uniref:Uncharacterized protein n=1 Tax=Carex littledalei TaxID=544730 RepID=A0A833V647_9POAL|nr:hypothetical protein FCM35_KLT07891 [Carex littledalei]
MNFKLMSVRSGVGIACDSGGTACSLGVACISGIVRSVLETSLWQISHFFIGSLSLSAIANLGNKLRFVSSCFVMEFSLLNSKFDLEINGGAGILDGQRTREAQRGICLGVIIRSLL